jgi:hypothetical protein
MEPEIVITPTSALWFVAVVLACAMLVPQALQASSVGALVSFDKGTVADADEVNANFATVQAAVDDNSARLDALE